MIKLIAVVDTLLKPNIQQSSELLENELVSIEAGTELDVLHAKKFDSGHVLVSLAEKQLDRHDHWVWSGHVKLIDEDARMVEMPSETDSEAQVNAASTPDNHPPARQKENGFRLPGYSSVFYLDEPIIQGGSFTWAEATHNGTRIPKTKEIVGGIIRVARQIQPYRDKIGRSIRVSSWYRTPEANRACGGASKSRHLYGDAVDINIDGLNKREIGQLFVGWEGGLGTYNHLPHTIHLDGRPYKARWGPVRVP